MVDRWAPLAINQVKTATGYIITLTTDIPCHLYLFYTFQQPWTHKRTTVDRGLQLPFDAYWCYVSWIIVEQDEPGDTLTHTFTIAPLVSCNHIWFRFAGYIGGVSSPSDSPIIHKHYTLYIPPPPEYYSQNFGETIGTLTVDAAQYRGYAFESEKSTTISQLTVSIEKIQDTEDGILDFWNVGADWKPYGAAIGSIIAPDADIPLSPNWADITFETPSLSLVQGLRYAFTFRLPTQYSPFAWGISSKAYLETATLGYAVQYNVSQALWLVGRAKDTRHWLT